MRRLLKNHIQHCCNPMHLYCRLREFGMPEASARRWCAVYEKFLYRAVFSQTHFS